ncbi:MAG: hypothetical protein KME21_06845 [Desmonostoc vinosum HA7617-LM4]|jgi:hypothetical protein|nr:hypothetical protein [Desmonostoc vinosum HA7617-LM4]
MSDRRIYQSQKTATSSLVNSSLTSSGIPTLANPTRGFGLQTDTAQQPSNLQQQPPGYDISRISLHRQTEDPISQSEYPVEQVANSPPAMNVIQCGKKKQKEAKNPNVTIDGGVKKKIKKTKAKKPSKAALGRAIKNAQATENWGFATGHSGSGQWTENVTVRDQHSFADDRVKQALRHLSSAVFHYVKSLVADEQEVQGLYVDDRLLLSSNLPASMQQLQNLTSEQLFDILLTSKYMPGNDDRFLQYVNKLRSLIGGTRIEDITTDEAEKANLQTIADMVRNAIQDPSKFLIHSTLDNASGYINDASYKNKIIIVEGLKPVHAEQNLIFAYCKSGSSSPALIYGKKRPCTGCYVTFRYATDILNLNIQFNPNAGGFWGPAVTGLWEVMKESIVANNITIDGLEGFVEKALPTMTHRTHNKEGKSKGDKTKSRTDTKAEETGYDSPSDTEAEDIKFTLADLKKPPTAMSDDEVSVEEELDDEVSVEEELDDDVSVEEELDDDVSVEEVLDEVSVEEMLDEDT